jgi:aspartate kinase
MLVFKFGGASVKDAAGVTNLARIVKKYEGQQLLIVVSAMGKMTNALERLTKAYADQSDELDSIYADIKAYHYHILEGLFEHGHPVFNEVANTFVEIDWMIEDEPHDDYDFIYDQIVSIGELVSTRIVAAYLNQAGIKTQWLDVRGYIHTDNNYREVGREGSDYTASIFASCLDAESVTTWKDVPGILNADPKFFADTIKFDELSYTEAIEMTYYGASVIHPKTIKPLQNAKIPLLVKSFNDPDAPGTVIKETATTLFEKPVIILKQNQVLLSISAKDYSFISEDHLSDIFKLFAQNHVKINVMQTSALSFTVCFDLYQERFEKLLTGLSLDFKVKYNLDISLITVRHYKYDALRELTSDKIVLLEQISRNTAQVVVK